MKRFEAKELSQRPLPELENLLKEQREKLRLMKFDLAAGKVKNVDELRGLKKKIARISTYIKIQSGVSSG